MNISNPRRVSYLRPPPHPVDAFTRPRTFHAVDFEALKAACDAERAAKPTCADIESLYETIPQASPGERLLRMLTVYPVRDMGYLVSITFALGSAALSANAALALLPPSSFFDALPTASLVSISTGSLLLVLAGFMSILTAFNVDRGTVDEKLDAEGAYKPALIGSAEWVWAPTWSEMRAVYLPSLAFRAGLVQLAGGFAFTIPSVAGVPGVVDLADPANILYFISAPQVVGGSLFLCAGLIILGLAQDRWYRPKLLDASWANGAWNTIGAAGFLGSGIASVAAPEQAVMVSALFLVGGLSFFLASLVQWYLILENHPA